MRHPAPPRPRPLFRLFVLLAAIALALPVAARGEIVDHRAVAGVATLPQEVMDAIGTQRWLFTHASVGQNIASGLYLLNDLDPDRYQLQRSWVDFDEDHQRAEDPPASPVPGTVYQCYRGNPGWAQKFAIFDNSVRAGGWHDPQIDAVLDKLCYIDDDAHPEDYLGMMLALRTSYPRTYVIYATIPLTSGSSSANIRRNAYNELVRAACASGGAILYDIADIEAHDPDGNEHTFSSGGRVYQQLYDGYTDDGGHLNNLGAMQVARGWYAVAALLTRGPLFSDGFEGGGTIFWLATP